MFIFITTHTYCLFQLQENLKHFTQYNVLKAVLVCKNNTKSQIVNLVKSKRLTTPFSNAIIQRIIEKLSIY
jgi:hypothetical protein